MKKYLKEIIILLIQLFMFYLFPIFTGPTDAMGMVFLIFIVTLILSMITGILLKENYKYFYPVIVSVLFIPSVLIYYNDSAFIHTLWYFLASSLGLLMGVIIYKIINRKSKHKF